MRRPVGPITNGRSKAELHAGKMGKPCPGRYIILCRGPTHKETRADNVGGSRMGTPLERSENTGDYAVLDDAEPTPRASAHAVGGTGPAPSRHMARACEVYRNQAENT